MDDGEAELALSSTSLPPTLASLSLFFLPIGMLPHFLAPSRRQRGRRCGNPEDAAPACRVSRSRVALLGDGSAAAHPPLPLSRPTPPRRARRSRGIAAGTTPGQPRPANPRAARGGSYPVERALPLSLALSVRSRRVHHSASADWFLRHFF